MSELTALQLAEYILASYPDKNITPMKLQKLAYYTKVWTLVAGSKLIFADFKKWDFGPVNTEIYSQYKPHGGGVIEGNFNSNIQLKKHEKKLLQFILDNYIDFSAFALSAMTHQEDPWVNTPKNNIIPDSLIIKYYSSQSFAKNFQNSAVKKGPFHLIQDDSWCSFTLDMDDSEAANFETYPSFEDYLEKSEKADVDLEEFIKDFFN